MIWRLRLVATNTSTWVIDVWHGIERFADSLSEKRLFYVARLSESGVFGQDYRLGESRDGHFPGSECVFRKRRESRQSPREV